MRRALGLALLVLAITAPQPTWAEEPSDVLEKGAAKKAKQEAARKARAAEVIRLSLGLMRRSDAALRKRALEDLALHITDFPELGPACVAPLSNAMKRHDVPDRILGMTLLGLIPGEAARTRWLEALDPRAEPDLRVLRAAVDAARLRDDDPGTLRALIQAARRPLLEPTHRALLLEAIGAFDGPAPLLVLRRPRAAGEAGPETWVEAAGRALGLGRRRDEASLPLLMGMLGHDSVAVQLAAWEALVARTKQGFPPDRATWENWWKARKDAARKPRKPEPGKKDERYAPTKHIHIPTYYNVPIPRPGSKVVFCLDVSQSMYGDGITSARRHLRKTLLELPMRHAFEIIAFNEKVLPFRKRLVEAHPVAKWRAIRWMDGLEPTSYTNLFDAVETAFQHMGRGRRPAATPVTLDMVFLLSDGHPNRGRFRVEERVVKHISRLSRRDVPVHTVAAGDRVMGLLKRISHATGGTFTDAFE